MDRKVVLFVLIPSLLVVLPISSQFISCGELVDNFNVEVNNSAAYNNYRIHNIDTDLNYATIQGAIDAPETLDGHTIFVEEGTYYEQVVVDKSLSLIGENRTGTVIDGNGTGTLMWIVANAVTISGFTLCNSGHDYNDCSILIEDSRGNNVAHNIVINNLYGVRLVNSANNTLTDNVASENAVGVYLWNSSYNQITRNDIDSVNNSCIALWQGSGNNIIRCNNISRSNCTGIYTNNSNDNTITFNNVSFNEGGIYLRESSYNILTDNNITFSTLTGLALRNITNSKIYFNIITHNPYGIYSANISNNICAGNTIADNEYGVLLQHCNNNTFHHNNFISNYIQASIFYSNSNSWDDHFEGNYWSDYDGKDSDRDGIDDSPYAIDANHTDNYPLMGMFSSFNTSLGYPVNVISNSTIANFEYFESNSTIRIYVSNMTANQTYGFCRICVPHKLMNPTSISVIIDDGDTAVLYPNYNIYDNGTHRWIYFAYEHSTHEVDIIAEFPPWTSMLLILIVLAVAIVVVAIVIHKRRQQLRTPFHQQ